MHGPVYKQLEPVRQRQRLLHVVNMTILGLLAGSVGGIGLELGKWAAGWNVATGWTVVVLGIGPVLGAALGLARRQNWVSAAAAVDSRYQLKNRTVTALEFLENPVPTVFHELQVGDAVRHLADVDLKKVMPLRLPKTLPYAAGALIAALALFARPFGSQPLIAGPSEPLPEVVAEAESIEEDLKAFEALAHQDEDKDLLKLVKEMQRQVEAMKQPGVDLREALAKLSDMQAALAAEQAKFNTTMVDGQLNSLGTAMNSAAALQSTGKALEEAKYEKAAKELEKLDNPHFEQKEAAAVHDKMQQVAREMQERKLGEMSAATKEMAAGVKGDKSKLRSGSRNLAKQIRSHDRRRRINQLLAVEQERLNDCKSRCQNPSLSWLPSPKSKSEGGSGAGKGHSDSLGQKTKLAANRKPQDLIGIEGEGPDEFVETASSPEGRQQAGRPNKDVYQKYRRLSETVLENEPIPLGQRQTIRRYFELIHPNNK